MLVIVCGLPGVGKTTVAEDVAERVDATRFRTDVIRKELFDDPDYTEVESYMVYETLFERAKELLGEGERVVLDATFQREADRLRAKAIASLLDVPFDCYEVTCDEAVVRERIAAREGDASDADFEIHQYYRDIFDPLSMPHTTIDNSGSEEETAEQVAACFESTVTPPTQ
ncbi:AAA family ATPase [Haloarchaeobius sp. TZWWS8]|uniref:AAA family ATPase n=1 Tax=Haloarchaeobius sp. TZWWS8 TaxID=3446121 RepID=UPI003EBC90E8